MSIFLIELIIKKLTKNSRKSINYRKFVKHCQVEHNITHDILSRRYDVV